LGLRARDLGPLFDVFEGVFYGSTEPGPAERDAAADAMGRATALIARTAPAAGPADAPGGA